MNEWNLETLALYFQKQIDDLRSFLDERYATQTKAVESAFIAQQTAMQTALTAADRAVQAALLSAEKAVTKAEVSANERFELLNELRSGVATVDQLHALEKRFNEFSPRFERLEASLTGIAAARLEDRQQSNWSTGHIVTAGLAIGAIILTIIGLFLK